MIDESIPEKRKIESLHYPVLFSTQVFGMTEEVVATRKGQTTIPANSRMKYRIGRGTKLQVVETEEGILFRPKVALYETAGSASSEASVPDMKSFLIS